MAEIREIDSKLYNAIYGIPKVGNAEIIWDIIRHNDAILAEAIEVEKDKFSEKTLVKGLAICRSILLDYRHVNSDIYEQLVNLVYSNTDIARIVVGGNSNEGDSFLLMTLWNHKLRLTKEQKNFAVSEAMNKIGTVLYEENKNAELNKAKKHQSNTINDLDSTQAHGVYPKDIRYEILRNPNWTIEEKRELIYAFWSNDDDYKNTLEEWEWDIINDEANYHDEPLPEIYISELYDYTYGYLCAFYGNAETADRIWEEIRFCKDMNMLRVKKSQKIIPFRKNLWK